MVEIKPSELKIDDKLEHSPSLYSIETYTRDIGLKYVDLIRIKSKELNDNWLNSDDTIVFELREPTTAQMNKLAVFVGATKPNRFDYMHTSDDCCIVYIMSWRVI